MAITKTARTLKTSASLAAAASVNATEWDLTAAVSGTATVRLTNGATAPTTAPTVRFFIGEATGKKYLLYTATGDTVNNSVTDIPCRFNRDTMFANITVINGATNAITVEAFGEELTTAA